MAWTTTKDFVGGAILTESDLDTYVSGNTDYLKTEVDSHHVLAGPTVYAKSGGVLYKSIPDAANSGSGETTLYSQSLEGSMLGADKETLGFECLFTTAANGNTKTMRVKFGSTTIATRADAINGGAYWIKGRIIRTGAATQRAFCWGTGDGSTGWRFYENSSPTETLSGAVTFAVTGQGTNTNDLVLRYVCLTWAPAGN